MESILLRCEEVLTDLLAQINNASVQDLVSKYHRNWSKF